MHLIVLGAGQYGMVVREIAETLDYSVEFLDDNNSAAIGKLDDWGKSKYENYSFFVAIGNSKIRSEYLDKLETARRKIITLISPRSSYVSTSAIIGVGSIVEPMVVVHTEVKVGRGVFVCAGAVVNHNAEIKDYCQIDVGSVIPAGAIVVANTKVEAGTVWKPSLGIPIKQF